MFILGLISFLQMVFIPGFILLKFVGINPGTGTEKSRKIQDLVYGFALSLLANYLLVFLFTSLGIYKSWTLYIVLLIEGLTILYFCLKKPSPRGVYLQVNPNKTSDSLKHYVVSQSLLFNILLLFSLIVILWYVYIFLSSIGTIFERWDPIFSWNRWALHWANNQLPIQTWHYPQLLPANWSITYVIMQNTHVQFFAKSIMPLFSIGTLLLFLDLGMRKKNATYLLGLIFYGILLYIIYPPSLIVSGYVDIAVSFFAFLSFHVMHAYPGENGKRDFKTVWLAVIFASAAAVTKQSGLYILLFILVWASRSFYRAERLSAAREKIGRGLLLLLTMVIIAGTWYALKEIHIQTGKDYSEIRGVQTHHPKTSYKERLTYGINRLFRYEYKKLTNPVYVVALLVALGLFSKRALGVTLFIAIPYPLIWGFFFSYDKRNLAFAIPFVAFSAAFGAAFLQKTLSKISQYKTPIIPVLVLGLLVLMVLNFTLLKKETLIRHQTRQKMKIGIFQLNNMLYRYHKRNGIKGKIATRYHLLKHLPGLKQFYWGIGNRVDTLAFLRSLANQKGKNIRYLLIREIQETEEKTKKWFSQKIKNKEYRVIFKSNGWLFVEMRR